ncbi:ferredoxin--NADP reductase [Kaarinaea lacus]
MSYLKATVTEIRNLTPSVKLFEFDFGNQEFNYLPGQWVDVQLNIDAQNQNAAFSITSSPNHNNAIEIAVKRVEHFPVSAHLHDQLHVGDAIAISPAQGDVVLPPQLQEPLVFIAGGTGVTPFISMLRQIYTSNPNFDATLIYSVCSAEEGLFYDELDALQREYTKFRFVFTTTREAAHHANFFGRIDSELLKRVGIDHKANYYLCGPPAMVDDIATLLTDLGMRQQQLHYDKWW